ncbi:hypothetical protein FA13DRAFT_1721934 [Coprinellus micaceus]|uniref:Uncharacterized protein n=1 Tax=Coprinellus micaceus TaxID=71717 RepID=A0A4Y7RTY9_COPMI|nr:hypothetical protein FA13DRAFT_1721934 [Coprinellus micaceus]
MVDIEQSLKVVQRCQPDSVVLTNAFSQDPQARSSTIRTLSTKGGGYQVGSTTVGLHPGHPRVLPTHTQPGYGSTGTGNPPLDPQAGTVIAPQTHAYPRLPVMQEKVRKTSSDLNEDPRELASLGSTETNKSSRGKERAQGTGLDSDSELMLISAGLPMGRPTTRRGNPPRVWVRPDEHFIRRRNQGVPIARLRLFMRHSAQEAPIIHRSRPTLPTSATGAVALQGMEGWIHGGVYITPNFEAIDSKFCETWRNNGRIGHGSLIFGMIL